MVVDQGLSSVSNFMVTAAVASAATVEEFGSVSLALLVYAVVLGLSRSFLGETLIAARSFDDSAGGYSKGQSARDAVACCLLGAVGVSVSLAVIAVVLDLVFLTILACALPLLLLQDVSRYLGFSLDKVWVAVSADLGWVALYLAYVVASVLGIVPGDATLRFAMWCVSGGAAGVLGIILAFVTLPAARGRVSPLRYIRKFGRLGAFYCGEYGLGSGAGQAVVAVAAVVASTEVLGAVRGAQLLLGPVAVLFTGLQVVLTVRGQDLLRRGGDISLLLVTQAKVGAGLGVFVAVLVGALWLLPDQVGELVLGETWHDARVVMLWLGLGAIATALGVAASSGLRATRSGSSAGLARLVSAPFVIAAGLAGAFFGSLHSLGVGIMLGNVCTALGYWFFFVRSSASGGGVSLSRTV
ncbi:hypothetical protein GHK92_19730 [Nocardioides sp. dk4132]|uniref:hypothetical protein n=1 Tax=unclassified Nocardioides TaxID=2615069 RepID=UPI001297BD49|nr:MULTISPECIES: hypothetical protein [unclassified Nocardioides]MQW78103.1 hypothetical protein [Nocardioides sp. dk4132]QGA09071.1 hypothetical protein GFH29_17975 [Nocardioides sp. dk884]